LLNKSPDYVTYPADLEKLTKKVTRAGAKLVCDRLVHLGILQTEKKRSPTWSKSTPHYRLREDKEAFIKLTQSYFRTLAKSDPYSWQKLASDFFMNSKYARRQINSNLVRHVLSSKKVVMPLIVKTKEENKNRKRNAVSKHSRDLIPLSLPIMPPDTKIAEMQSRVIMHKTKLADDQKETITKFVKNHYDNIEENAIISPILALLQISPSALRYFLSNWKPHLRGEGVTFFSTSLSFDMIEHVLFRLIWNAINDFSRVRVIPEWGIVHDAYVSGGNYPSGKSSPLLLLRCSDNLSIEYEAGFDSVHDYYGDEVVEIKKTIGHVKINWRKSNSSKPR
jgi:hypothetical protein